MKGLDEGACRDDGEQPGFGEVYEPATRPGKRLVLSSASSMGRLCRSRKPGGRASRSSAARGGEFPAGRPRGVDDRSSGGGTTSTLINSSTSHDSEDPEPETSDVLDGQKHRFSIRPEPRPPGTALRVLFFTCPENRTEPRPARLAPCPRRSRQRPIRVA